MDSTFLLRRHRAILRIAGSNPARSANLHASPRSQMDRQRCSRPRVEGSSPSEEARFYELMGSGYTSLNRWYRVMRWYRNDCLSGASDKISVFRAIELRKCGNEIRVEQWCT